MKKIHLIEAISSFLASDLTGDVKGKYHPEEIKTWLNTAFNQTIYNVWLNGKKYSDFSQLDAWSRTYEVTVLAQVGTNAHALLPIAPVQLPDGFGIRLIADHDDSDTVLCPVEATSNPIFAELEVNTMDDMPTYRLEQSNVFVGAGEASHMLKLEKMPVAPDAITSLDVMMVTSPENLDDFDDLAIPAGSEDALVRMVIDLMSRKPQVDNLNDMNPQPAIQ
jgi:hypothetical protein